MLPHTIARKPITIPTSRGANHEKKIIKIPPAALINPPIRSKMSCKVLSLPQLDDTSIPRRKCFCNRSEYNIANIKLIIRYNH